MPYYSIAAQLLVHAILYRYSAWQIGELPQVANAGPPPPCPHSWQAHGQAWWWQPGQHCRAPVAAKHFLLVQRGMGKVNCYRRSSAEHEPYDTTEVRHLRPGNSQRAAYVYIAYFSEKMEDKVGGTFDERVGRTQLLSRCVFLRRRSQISSVTGGGGGGNCWPLLIRGKGVSQMLTRGGGGVANADQCWRVGGGGKPKADHCSTMLTRGKGRKSNAVYRYQLKGI